MYFRPYQTQNGKLLFDIIIHIGMLYVPCGYRLAHRQSILMYFKFLYFNNIIGLRLEVDLQQEWKARKRFLIISKNI